MNMETENRQAESDGFSSSLPLILLASDNPRLAEHLHRSFQQQGLSVELAPGYSELEGLAQTYAKGIALIEVSHPQSVEAAVELALRLKRHNTRRFVGYLADPILHSSGLAGDAIFPRSAPHLITVLRSHFRDRL